MLHLMICLWEDILRCNIQLEPHFCGFEVKACVDKSMLLMIKTLPSNVMCTVHRKGKIVFYCSYNIEHITPITGM